MTNVLSSIRADAVPLHTRTLSIVMGRDAAGTFGARGDVIDLRKNGCVPSVDDVQPAGIIHAMKIDLDFDPATLRLDRIAVDQPFVAVEPSPATGGECCRDPAPRLVALTGDRFDEGFTRRLSTAFGGALGCSHLLTLFQLLASTVPHAMTFERARAASEKTEAAPAARFFRRALYVDGQLERDGSIGVAIQLTDTHTRPPFPGNRGFERLVEVREVKVFARVERKRFTLAELEVRERRRDGDAAPDAAWTDLDAQVAPLVGQPLIPGMAGRVFKLFAEDAQKNVVRDSLLQLAPGFIQITAALMDQSLRTSIDLRGREPVTPSVSGIGGMPDSCYMWRKDSPFTVSRREAMLPRAKSGG